MAFSDSLLDEAIQAASAPLREHTNYIEHSPGEHDPNFWLQDGYLAGSEKDPFFPSNRVPIPRLRAFLKENDPERYGKPPFDPTPDPAFDKQGIARDFNLV